MHLFCVRNEVERWLLWPFWEQTFLNGHELEAVEDVEMQIASGVQKLLQFIVSFGITSITKEQCSFVILVCDVDSFWHQSLETLPSSAQKVDVRVIPHIAVLEREWYKDKPLHQSFLPSAFDLADQFAQLLIALNL